MHTQPEPAPDLAAQLVRCYQTLHANGLCEGTSGNVSVRAGSSMLITPSAVPAATLKALDIVQMPLDGQAVPIQPEPPGTTTPRPSSEWRFHHDILVSRPDIHAIVHTHSPHATALAMNRESIPAAHYMIAAFGGHDIRCAPYARYGSQALSDHAVTALNNRKACLLANHGAIVLGVTLEEAAALARELELLAQQYILACQAGSPVLLRKEEIDDALEAF